MAKADHISNHTSNLPLVSFEVDSIVGGTNRSYNKTPQQEPRFTQSGHLIDQQLKNNKDNLTAKELGLPEGEDFHLGINLPTGPDLLVNTLSRLIEEKSDNPKYLGNRLPAQVELFSKTLPAPRYETSYFDLAKENSGKEKPTGPDIQEVKASLKYLSEKNHIFIRIEKNELGVETIRRDLTQKVIVNIEEEYKREDLSAEEERSLGQGSTASSVTSKAKIIITLNPIFSLDIGGKFIQKPKDINLRLREASGSKNVSEAIRKLSNYLFRCCSSPETRKTGQAKIGKALLIETLGLNIKYKGRKAELEKQLDKAIKACSHDRLPLILSVELTKSKKHEEDMYIFNLNIDFANKRLPAQSLEISQEAA